MIIVLAGSAKEILGWSLEEIIKMAAGSISYYMH